MQFEQYTIRLLTLADLEAFYHTIDKNRDRLKAFFTGTVARTNSLQETSDYLHEVMDKINSKSYLPHIVSDESNQKIIGFIDIKNIDWNIPKGELGCFMDADFAGKGLSKKAFGIFTDHCFRELGFRKLFLRTHESNVAARKLAESCGFQIEGTLRCDYKTTEGELVDLLYYGRLPHLI